jgi:hypothetical protein
VLSSVAGVMVVGVEPVAPVVVRTSLGRGGPPDPYPPRSFVLS